MARSSLPARTVHGWAWSRSKVSRAAAKCVRAAVVALTRRSRSPYASWMRAWSNGQRSAPGRRARFRTDPGCLVGASQGRRSRVIMACRGEMRATSASCAAATCAAASAFLPGPDRGLDHIHDQPQRVRDVRGKNTRRADSGSVPVGILKFGAASARRAPGRARHSSVPKRTPRGAAHPAIWSARPWVVSSSPRAAAQDCLQVNSRPGQQPVAMDLAQDQALVIPPGRPAPTDR